MFTLAAIAVTQSFIRSFTILTYWFIRKHRSSSSSGHTDPPLPSPHTPFPLSLYLPPGERGVNQYQSPSKPPQPPHLHLAVPPGWRKSPNCRSPPRLLLARAGPELGPILGTGPDSWAGGPDWTTTFSHSQEIRHWQGSHYNLSHPALITSPGNTTFSPSPALNTTFSPSSYYDILMEASFH